jgi:hypothetical protein
MKDKIVKKIKDFLRRFDIYSFDDAFVCGSLLSFAIMFLAAILNIALDRMGIRDEQISFMVIRICSIFLFILIALKIIQGILIFLNALQEDINAKKARQQYYENTCKEYELLCIRHERLESENRYLLEQIESLESQIKEYEDKQKD